MNPIDSPDFSPRWLRIALAGLTVALTFVIRVSDITHRFWLLGDQIRDWAIALGPITSLPLVGDPTHVHGYTIGPAFLWLLWVIRVIFGPWFQNLPHAGGIGQALLQSIADAVLLIAVWKRTGSVWLGLTTVVLLATAPFDLSLSAVIWNPIAGSMLARMATALVLLNWPRQSLLRVGVTAAVAWSAVHAYTGTIYVALAVFAALVVDQCVRRDWGAVWRRSVVIAGAVAVLQIPYAIYRLSHRADDRAMGAVTDSLAAVLSGRAQVRLGTSAAFYMTALTSIQAAPWSYSASVCLLLGCGVVLATRYRRDPVLLAVTLLPQALAIVGYALWLGDLDSYYYFSLMPAGVLTIVLAAGAIAPQRHRQIAAFVLFLFALSVVPARLRAAATMFRMPEYGALVAGSREIVKRKQPIQSIDLETELPPTGDTEFIFRILGGQIDRRAEWRAVISPDGRVTYYRATGIGR